MNALLALFLLLGIDAAVLFYEASSLSLTYHGAQLLYTDAPGVMTHILHGSLALFGHTETALRLPMILMNLGSALLLYHIAAPYAKHDRERVWLVGIFILLPGIISSSLLVDSAALTTFGLFTYLLVRQRREAVADLLLPLLVWADGSFMFLPLGLAWYAYKQRNLSLLPLYGVLFFFALWYHGFDTGGVPQSQFLDTLGLYAAVLSPVVFLYLFYTIYRRYIASQTDLLWYVAATALLLSLLLSFRQRVQIEQFAPYFMAALPLGMQTFFHSYRVRLRPFRKRYRMLFVLGMGILVLNAFAVVFNKAAYLFLEQPERYFAYRAHVAKELADGLRDADVPCGSFTDDPKMQLRLRFYGFGACPGYQISRQKAENANLVTIRYYGSPVASYYVTKVPII